MRAKSGEQLLRDFPIMLCDTLVLFSDLMPGSQKTNPTNVQCASGLVGMILCRKNAMATPITKPMIAEIAA